MDPFSLTTGVLGMLSVAASAVKGVEKLRIALKADDSVCALINQLTDLKCLLASVDPSQAQLSQNQISNVQTIFERVTSKTAELENILNSRLLKKRPVVAEPAVDRIAWLREKPRVESIRKELRYLTLTLALMFTASTSGTVQRVELAVMDLAAIVDYSYSAQRAMLEATDNAISRLDRIDKLLCIQQLGVRDILSLQGVADEKSTACIKSDFRDLSYETPCAPKNSIDPTESSRLTSDEFEDQDALLSYSNSCSKACCCSCHVWRWMRSPMSLKNALGLLILGYSGLPVSLQQCSVRSCRNRKREFAGHLVWYFPSWFANRVFQASFRMGTVSGPEFIFRLSHTVPASAACVAYSQASNIRGLKFLYKNGLASPYDVEASTGFTALHVSD